jgi:hypothetical protein
VLLVHEVGAQYDVIGGCDGRWQRLLTPLQGGCSGYLLQAVTLQVQEQAWRVYTGSISAVCMVEQMKAWRGGRRTVMPVAVPVMWHRAHVLQLADNGSH